MSTPSKSSTSRILTPHEIELIERRCSYLTLPRLLDPLSQSVSVHQTGGWGCPATFRFSPFRVTDCRPVTEYAV